ncbi:hypothetical protein PsorP6_017179 [Peronosclerospora sorghi]|uniref:Uncharacterized protein n=1 Tax=Peronosclerospora sorghi TaxID=230839 RepID=A0ACC0WGB3_9STRA|nr:hypothetical protein PsorP6_017179 [Peronosclerospora sorghi]
MECLHFSTYLPSSKHDIPRTMRGIQLLSLIPLIASGIDGKTLRFDDLDGATTERGHEERMDRGKFTTFLTKGDTVINTAGNQRVPVSSAVREQFMRYNGYDYTRNEAEGLFNRWIMKAFNEGNLDTVLAMVKQDLNVDELQNLAAYELFKERVTSFRDKMKTNQFPD